MNKRKYIVVFVIVLLLAAVVGLFHTFFVSARGKEIYNGFVGSGEYQIEELVWSE